MFEFNGRKFLDPDEEKFFKRLMAEIDARDDFHGTKVNQDKLDQFNTLSALAHVFLARIREPYNNGATLEIYEPHASSMYASVDIIVRGKNGADINIENESIGMFRDLIELSDAVTISTQTLSEQDVSLTGNRIEVVLSFSVDNIFEK